MKIAVLGGSFNPIHVGHAMLADSVIKELGYDKVIFVPTCIPPHKIMSVKISAEQRFDMVKAFCDSEGDGHFIAEKCEIDRGGVSYTSDTVEFLTQKYKDVLEGKLGFIFGDEVASEFDKWHEPEKIASYVDFIITRRYPVIDKARDFLSKQSNTPSGAYKGDFAVSFDIQKFGYPCTYMENPVLPVSSTEIRSRVAEGRSYKYLVPQSVFKYIEKEGLYK